jgi:hypothetical protein
MLDYFHETDEQCIRKPRTASIRGAFSGEGIAALSTTRNNLESHNNFNKLAPKGNRYRPRSSVTTLKLVKWPTLNTSAFSQSHEIL